MFFTTIQELPFHYCLYVPLLHPFSVPGFSRFPLPSSFLSPTQSPTLFQPNTLPFLLPSPLPSPLPSSLSSPLPRLLSLSLPSSFQSPPQSPYPVSYPVPYPAPSPAIFPVPSLSVNVDMKPHVDSLVFLFKEANHWIWGYFKVKKRGGFVRKTTKLRLKSKVIVNYLV